MRVLQTAQAARKVQLDVYDRKILFALAQNCRTSATQIGRRIGLSRDAVRYRIARLEKAEVIQGYRTVVDVSRFGYLIVHLLLQLNQPTPEAEKQLVETFKNYSFCRTVIKFSGKYDFDLAFVAKDSSDLDRILTKIISDCGSYLQHYELLFITKPFTVGKSFPDNFVNMQREKVEKKSESYTPDETDIKLLDIIADNAALPLYHIGQKLGLSADAVKYRMKKLVNAGIITGFVPVINYDVIGYNVYAILLDVALLTQKRESTLAQFLATNKDVLWAVKTIGNYNVLLYICTTDPDDLVKTTSALRSHFTEAVRNFETLINYEQYKYTYWVNIGKSSS